MLPNKIIMIKSDDNSKYIKIWAMIHLKHNKYRIYWGILNGEIHSEILAPTISRHRRSLKTKLQLKYQNGYSELTNSHPLANAVITQLDQHDFWLKLSDQSAG